MAGGSLGEAVFDLAADTEPLAKGMKEGEKIVKSSTSNMQDATKRSSTGMGSALKGLSSVAGGILKGAFVVGTAAVVGMVGALGGCVAAAMDAQKTEAQLNAVLESTGGKAGVTKESVLGLADSLSRVTVFEDDAIVAGESMLLTFTNIGADVFPMATQAMLDMSQATGQDMQSSAIQLGKALNDPIAGISALSRVGVTFTDSQKAAITAMVESGNVMGAQKLMLAELTTEFGGSAVAAGQTLPGQLTILKNTLGNVAEGIGMALIPALTGLAQTIISVLGSPMVQTVFTAIANGLGALASGDVSLALMYLHTALQAIFGPERAAQIYSFLTGIQAAMQTAFAWVQANVIPIVLQLAGMIQQFVAEHLEGLKGALIAIGVLLAGAAIVMGLIAIAGTIAALMNPITLIIGAVALLGFAWSENWGGIQQKVEAVLGFLKPYIEGAITFIQTIITTVISAVRSFWAENHDAIQAKAMDIWRTVQEFIGAAIGFVEAVIRNTIDVITRFWKENHDTILETARTIWATIKGVIQTVVDVIQGIIKVFTDILKGNWKEAWEDLKATAKRLLDGILELVKNILKLVQGEFKLILGLIKVMIGEKLLEWKTTFTDKLTEMRTAITDKLDEIKGKAQTFLDNVRSIISEFSLVDAGRNLIEGLARGVTAAAGAIASAVRDAVNGAVRAALNALGLRSPSKVFADIGLRSMEGLQLGIMRGNALPLRALDLSLQNMLARMNVVPDLVIGGQLALAGADADMYHSGESRTYALTYNALRPEAGRDDAARAMREMEMWARLEG